MKVIKWILVAIGLGFVIAALGMEELRPFWILVVGVWAASLIRKGLRKKDKK